VEKANTKLKKAKEKFIRQWGWGSPNAEVFRRQLNKLLRMSKQEAVSGR
jgi:hypothetical protein